MATDQDLFKKGKELLEKIVEKQCQMYSLYNVLDGNDETTLCMRSLLLYRSPESKATAEEVLYGHLVQDYGLCMVGSSDVQ